MNYLGDALKAVVGYPTSTQVAQAHKALVTQYESHIGQIRSLRNVSLICGVAGGVLLRSPILAVAGVAVAVFAEISSSVLENRLTAVKSNPNLVHAAAHLPYTKPVDY